MTDLVRVVNPKLYSNAMSAPALAVFVLLLKNEPFRSFARINLLTQLAVFIPTVQIPTLLTGRLSYVDIAWPTGLFAMGLVSLIRQLRRLVCGKAQERDDGGQTVSTHAANCRRALLISLAYMFQGGRMALGAWTMFFSGHMRNEMQRYTYQRRRWAAVGILAGSFAEKVELQKEAFTQCLANIGPLAVPLALQSCVNAGQHRFIEVVGWSLWIASFAWEHASDLQKVAFGRAMKQQGLRKKVCNFGLWNYSRHPNYFGEWMVWVSLALASLPAFQRFWNDNSGQKDKQVGNSVLSRLGMALSLLSVPTSMYICLVHWTGATPAEFYSLQNRPDYAQYCQEVNCFFPWPRRAARP
eukprot:TRINITY_DN67144_c0_g1_i1.p1 TRINITY_DN67144_c0_g1~~TRINITY_DN67144_c0_g1_i1.p1  ORF type:complete len:355 (+),score=39.37 TRINITY_DN67144_c0_g1_i1:73-1137(+)